MKQRDGFQVQLHELKMTVRNLQVDKKYLEDHCTELNQKIFDLEHYESGDLKHKKNKNDLINNNRKPFVSTVRSGSFLPSTLKECSAGLGGSCCRCTSDSSRQDLAHLDAERERNHAKAQVELVELYKKQLDSRDREINRLNSLLIGGRPASALAKDCCYRGVGSLTEDVEQLQTEKSKIQLKLERCLQSQHEAMERAMSLEEKNQRLTKELNAIEKVALSVESEANNSLGTLHKQNLRLRVSFSGVVLIVLCLFYLIWI